MDCQRSHFCYTVLLCRIAAGLSIEHGDMSQAYHIHEDVWILLILDRNTRELRQQLDTILLETPYWAIGRVRHDTTKSSMASRPESPPRKRAVEMSTASDLRGQDFSSWPCSMHHACR